MGSRKTDRLLTGVLSGAAFSVSSIIANLALLPIIFHQIGAAQYGMWLLLSAFAAYLYQADLGMGATMVHFAARHRGASVTEQREILSTGAAWMGLAGLVVLPLYVVVGHILVTLRGGGAHLTPEQGKVLLALGSLLVAGIGLRVFPSTLQGYGFLVIQRATQTIAVVVRVVATVVACFVLRSLIALAVGETIALLTPPVLCALELRRRGIPMPAWGSVRRTRFKEMIRYGIRAFCVGAMAIILLQGDAIIVGVVVNAAAVAYYGAAFRVYNSVLSAIGWMTDPLLAALTRLYGNDSARAREMFLGMLFATLWFACAVCGTLIIGAPGLIRVWLGPNVPTAEIATTLAVLLLGLMMSSTHEAAIPASGAIGATGRVRALVCRLGAVQSRAQQRARVLAGNRRSRARNDAAPARPGAPVRPAYRVAAGDPVATLVHELPHAHPRRLRARCRGGPRVCRCPARLARPGARVDPRSGRIRPRLRRDDALPPANPAPQIAPGRARCAPVNRRTEPGRAHPLAHDRRRATLVSHDATRRSLVSRRRVGDMGRMVRTVAKSPSEARYVPRLVKSRGANALQRETPWLPFRAIEYLESIATGAVVFEFGAGGSTAWFSRRAARVVSVEHDASLVRGAVLGARRSAQRRAALRRGRASRGQAGTWRRSIGSLTSTSTSCSLTVVAGSIVCSRAVAKVRPGGRLDPRRQ